MQAIKSRYSFDENKEILKPYIDKEIQNHYYKGIDLKHNTLVLVSIYYSTKVGQIASYSKKLLKFKDIKHPNLTQIIEVVEDEDNNRLFIVLEWTQGNNFSECLGKQNCLNWELSIKIIFQIYEGLKQIHRKSLTHNFVNLQNVQISEKGTAKLSFKNLIYKTLYLSPEVKEKHQKTKESDIFSLGVCLYRMLFGVMPFKQKKKQDYLKSIKNGVSRYLDLSEGIFPIVISKEIQELINLMCHQNPSLRSSFDQKLKKIHKIEDKKLMEESWLKNSDGRRHIELQSHRNQLQIIESIVLQPEKRKILKMEIIKHNLTELSTYIQQTIAPFKNERNVDFANIEDFYSPQKNILVIIYQYCGQGSLLEYRSNTPLDQKITEKTIISLRQILSHWRNQYRFLTNEQILLKKGKPAIKFPPFPTDRFKKRLAESKKGNFFYAPELQSGIQSKTADSWSIGVLEYWMRFDKMPVFDDQGTLVIPERSKLSIDQIKQMSHLIQKKHLDRKNLFPEEEKETKQPKRTTIDSASSQSDSISKSKVKEKKNAPLQSIRITQNIQEEDEQLELQLVQIEFDEPPNQPRGSPKKMRRNTENNTNQIKQKMTRKNSESRTSDIKKSLQTKKAKQNEGESVLEQQKNQKTPQKVNEVQITIFDQVLNEQISQDPKDKRMLRRKKLSQSRSPSQISEQKVINQLRAKVDNKNKLANRNSISVNPISNNLDDVEQEKDFKKNIFNKIQKQGYKLSQIQKHWTKPIRISIKCLIGFLMYFFLFYYSFFVSASSLIQSKYELVTNVVQLRGSSFDITPTINFTLVTRSPVQTHTLLTNKTLLEVRDEIRCVVNDYNSQSNVLDIITNTSFATYSVFGMIFSLLHIISLFVILAKLDLPKAFTLIKFQDHYYVPFYSWLFANLALASLTSCIYLIYGGLFGFQIDPCIQRPRVPSLIFLLKKMVSSFAWRFCWVYIGIIVAFVVIIYFLNRSSVRLSQKYYIILFCLYLFGIGARGMGSYDGSKQSVFGVCGQLLSLLTGVIFLVVDYVFCCKINRKVESKNRKESDDQIEDVNKTQDNLKQFI